MKGKGKKEGTEREMEAVNHDHVAGIVHRDTARVVKAGCAALAVFEAPFLVVTAST